MIVGVRSSNLRSYTRTACCLYRSKGGFTMLLVSFGCTFIYHCFGAPSNGRDTYHAFSLPSTAYSYTPPPPFSPYLQCRATAQVTPDGGPDGASEGGSDGESEGGSEEECAEMYGKCGGVNWSGPTCCKSGAQCNKYNDHHSQCEP